MDTEFATFERVTGLIEWQPRPSNSFIYTEWGNTTPDDWTPYWASITFLESDDEVPDGYNISVYNEDAILSKYDRSFSADVNIADVSNYAYDSLVDAINSPEVETKIDLRIRHAMQEIDENKDRIILENQGSQDNEEDMMDFLKGLDID